jgi:hypothetical protein
MSEPSENAPKIIVDDDWKTQVEKEKLAAAQSAKDDSSSTTAASELGAAADAESLAGTASKARGKADNDLRGGEGPETPPPATFEMLITMLFTQAMAALGQLPGPDGTIAPVNKPFAKYFIDTVELLGDKTKGNLSDDESKMLSEALHAMRMAFVSVKAK